MSELKVEIKKKTIGWKKVEKVNANKFLNYNEIEAINAIRVIELLIKIRNRCREQGLIDW